MADLEMLRENVRAMHIAGEAQVIESAIAIADVSSAKLRRIAVAAEQVVKDIRSDDQPDLMEVFLAEYGLSTDEGIALMCLAEALLRVPDADTIDRLIEDKIAPSSWGEHLGQSSSSLVNASTWALMLTGKVLDEKQSTGIARTLHSALKRLGEPVIRTAVKRAMKELGNQFVLGETIDSALKRGQSVQQQGFTYSYDMLGEAALTAKDASAYYEAYKNSIEFLADHSNSQDIRDNPGISIKLSALHPRYEMGKKQRVLDELVDRALQLCLLAKDGRMGLNIDAEEANRLDLSLDVIEAVLGDHRLAGWDGLGVVVQAYGKRALPVIDWLYALAETHSRKIMVRLVKGAYWDSEIKRSQVEGLADFPVFTNKAATDISYVCCAKKLLGLTDRIYPQFATHNAHTVSAVLELASDRDTFEFQRLHGMGEALHRLVRLQHGTRCRIYAPVGAHRDLLAYLVRRLLENGANSSFVNQIVDQEIPANEIATDPFKYYSERRANTAGAITFPRELYKPSRVNSRGWDLHNADDIAEIDAARSPFFNKCWKAEPLMAAPFKGHTAQKVTNPADPSDLIGEVVKATAEDVSAALEEATPWRDTGPADRSNVLNRAADLYEANFGEIFAVLAREAGKNPVDAIAELREAVDFLRYYATQTDQGADRCARGLIGCISPWNFPLAIFTGQIAAALAAGNGVLAKPAEPTPLVACMAVGLLHDAGVPRSVLQLLPGRGSVVGATLTGDPRIKGVCFTGSTDTAQIINGTMARAVDPDAPLIAETGGLNAMIVDSTALPEQAIKDIVASSFQSAGQRCSALRILYLQEDIATPFKEMLFGAMDELSVGDPWEFSTDVGSVINDDARREIDDHISAAKAEGRLLKQLDAPQTGIFVGPAVIEVAGMRDMHREIFGPVLHIATFKNHEVERIIDDINGSGYGLTFGLHTRVDDRVEQLTSMLNVGNMYVNRNQIGAIVGSQPFGGEGLSGTGPKAGGPHYVRRFSRPTHSEERQPVAGTPLPFSVVQEALRNLPIATRSKLKSIDLPGPTGESNRLSLYPRGTVLCLGPSAEDALEQASIAREHGCLSLMVCPGAAGDHALSGFLDRVDLKQLAGFDAVALWSNRDDLAALRVSLSQRSGPIVPLISEQDMAPWCVLERHVCVDTTASGGNASLLAGTESDRSVSRPN